MKKHFKYKNLLDAGQDEPGITVLINRVLQQLSAIEKKLDTLISQPSKKPFEKSYSQKPFRSFNRSHGHDRGRQGSGPREKTYTRAICADCNNECEIPFKPSGDRPVYCKECFPNHKKGHMFNTNRNNRPRKSQKPFKKKKPFFASRKK